MTTFADNLYGGCPNLAHIGGCGLFGFSDHWIYERHSDVCAPGMWRVAPRVGDNAGEFGGLVRDTQAVVDDFGSLRRVK